MLTFIFGIVFFCIIRFAIKYSKFEDEYIRIPRILWILMLFAYMIPGLNVLLSIIATFAYLFLWLGNDDFDPFWKSELLESNVIFKFLFKKV